MWTGFKKKSASVTGYGSYEESLSQGVVTGDKEAFNRVEPISTNEYEDPQTTEDEDVPIRKIFWKLDLRIIPALWVLYFLSSYGSVAYGNALTMNYEHGHSIPQYLKLTPHQRSLATTLNYVGSLVFDLPMNLCFTIVTPKVWLSRVLISVGLVYACIAAVNNAAGLQAARFFTGVATAGVWPGMTYYISSFYPVDMLSQRIGFYFTAIQVSSAVAGLLAAAFQNMDGIRGYTGYQWNFIIYGVITVTVGGIVYFWLPNRPKGQKIWPLSKREVETHQRLISSRIKAHKKWTWHDFFQILGNIRIWPFIFMYFGIVGTGIAILQFSTTMLKSYNPKWSGITLSLLTAPIWLVNLGGILIITPWADRYTQHRALLFSFSTFILMSGLFICTFARGVWSKWAGLLVCGFGMGSTYPICISWAATVFYRFHGDLGVAMSVAMITSLGGLGSVTTTYALYSGWPEDVIHEYRNSNMVMVAILAVSIIAAGCNTLLQYYLGDFGEKSLIDVTFLNWFRGRAAHKSQPMY